MSALPSAGLFGLGPSVPRPEAVQLVEAIRVVWSNQLQSLPGSRSKAAAKRIHDSSLPSLMADLEVLKYWFDPVASGRRLREALDDLRPLGEVLPSGDDGDCFLEIDEGRVLVTPEGRATLWAIEERLAVQDSNYGAGEDLYLPESTIRVAVTAVHDTYQAWILHRIRGVTNLLQSETATMRPTVAGLLLTLLINRNTSRDRRLPAPTDPNQSVEISRAITGPALAFARAMAGTDNATSRGLDLYRGWAVGEIARRLGSGFHKDREGIWIDPAAEPRARERLVESIRDRPVSAQLRVPYALDRALAEYNEVRPVLSALGAAHERPANTRKLLEELRSAATTRASTEEETW